MSGASYTEARKRLARKARASPNRRRAAGDGRGGVRMMQRVVFAARCVMWLTLGMIVGSLLSVLIHGVKQVAPEVPWSMVWLGILALLIFIGGLMGFDEDNHED